MPRLELNRRQFLTGVAAAPLLAVSATAAYARLIGPYSYHVAENDVFIRDLPERFENFRITQITDVHHSRIVGLDEVRRVVELAQSTKPDLIALTGDYTTTYRRYIEPCAEALGGLSAPEGVWAVLGNHDHYTDRELTTRALERNHIPVLNNSNTTLSRGPESLQLVGIDDWSWAGTNWYRAFHGVDPGRPTVLLSHQPNVLDVAANTRSLFNSQRTHSRRADQSSLHRRPRAACYERPEICARPLSQGRNSALCIEWYGCDWFARQTRSQTRDCRAAFAS